MAEPKIQSLPEEEAIDEIVETVRLAAQGTAPFALVLGSGFSQGLVPVVREIVGEILPLWMKSLKEHQSFETQKEIPHNQRAEIARDFWSEFVKRNASRGLVLPLDSQTGLPETYSDAYKAVFTPEYFGAVGEPFQARRFQRALMQLDKPRLNAAHQVKHGLAPFRVGDGTHISARLVQQEIAMPLGDLDPAAVDADVVVRRIGFRAELADRDAVHRHAAVEHQLL